MAKVMKMKTKVTRTKSRNKEQPLPLKMLRPKKKQTSITSYYHAPKKEGGLVGPRKLLLSQ
jgi:hypothetical protein